VSIRESHIKALSDGELMPIKYVRLSLTRGTNEFTRVITDNQSRTLNAYTDVCKRSSAKSLCVGIIKHIMQPAVVYYGRYYTNRSSIDCSRIISGQLGWKTICHAFLWCHMSKLSHTVKYLPLPIQNCPSEIQSRCP